MKRLACARARFDDNLHMSTMGGQGAPRRRTAKVSEAPPAGQDAGAAPAPGSDRLGPLTHDLLHTVAVLNAYAVTLDETWDGLDDGARHDIVRWILVRRSSSETS